MSDRKTALELAAPSRAKTYSLATHYLGEHVHIRRLKESLGKYTFLGSDHPLAVELAPDVYAVVTKFGTVTFWNADRGLARSFLEKVRSFTDRQKENYPFEDTLKVVVGAVAEKATFEEVYLRKLDKEKIRIISYVSAQSVALDRYEEEIDQRLEELGKVVEDMKSAGRTRLNQQNLLKQIGNVLSVKQHAVSNLALFDKPEVTWKREEIEELYLRLRNEYELKDRFDILNEKIDFLSENNVTLINFISSQRANSLELIVIVLILIEIVLFGFEIFKFF